MAVTYEPIATTTLGSNTDPVTFSSIPSTYTDLKIVVNALISTNATLSMYFNGSTSALYSYTLIRGNGTTISSAQQLNGSYIDLNFNLADGSTTIPQFISIDIFNYAGSTNKSLLVSKYFDRNGAGVTGSLVGLWRNTSAISSVSFTTQGSTILPGSTFTLYGIKAA